MLKRNKRRRATTTTEGAGHASTRPIAHARTRTREHLRSKLAGRAPASSTQINIGARDNSKVVVVIAVVFAKW